MAATLTADQDLVYFSWAIEKAEETPDGDLRVFGKCTDGSLDRDLQVVDVEWSKAALKEWLDTGGNVRLQHDPRRPVGKGLNLDFSADGHYLEAIVVEPAAKELVKKGVLTAYSIGVSHPKIDLDPTGKAMNGIIRGRPDGQTEIAEVSLVDRPSNRSCGFALVKRAGDGSPEWVGTVWGADDLLTKAAVADDTVNLSLPKDVSMSFSPADLAKLLEHRRVAEERMTAKRKFDPDVGGGVDRDKIPAEDFAGKNRSFPIVTQDDVGDALQSIGRAGADNYDADTLRANIHRIARRKGFSVPGDDSEKAAKPKGKKCPTCKGDGKIRGNSTNCPDCKGKGFLPAGGGDAGKAPAQPEVAKQDGDSDDECPPGKMRADDHDDDDVDSEADSMDKAAKEAAPDMTKKPKVPCPSCKKMVKAKAKFCPFCGKGMGGSASKASKPTPADHATGEQGKIEPAPEHREPDGPAIEALEHDASLPTVPDSSVKVSRFLAVKGIPAHLGALHDLCCPAYDLDTVGKAHPHAHLGMIDLAEWQAKALEIAASAPLEKAQEAVRVWQHALTLKQTPPALFADIKGHLHKAFRDANPGPGSAPTPGEVPASRFHRPYITDGHAAPSPGQDGPHTDPVHAGHISASDFRRDWISPGHQADSPGNPAGRTAPPAPASPGVPTAVHYTDIQRDNTTQAMSAMHDHVAQSFPDLCPMYQRDSNAGDQQSHSRPVPVGVGMVPGHGASKAAQPEVAKAGDPKAAKRLRRKLAQKVFKGKMTINAARAELGYEPVGEDEFIAKMGAPPQPDLIKAAVADALSPLAAQIEEARALIEKQDKRLRKQAEVLDAIAGQPDPNVTAYRGAALIKQASAAPAGPLNAAGRVEHAQDATVRALFDQWRNSPDPALREAAWADLKKFHGLNMQT